MPQIRDNNYHSEEAQEILGRIPSWIIRWGITVIFSIFAGIIIGCCFIGYPERVNATVTVTTVNAPVDVLARSGGNIEAIYVSNEEMVNAGDILGIIHTGADYTDVLYADSCLMKMYVQTFETAVFDNAIYEKYSMGDLQGDWTSFSSSCKKYRDYLEMAVIRKKKILIGEQIDKQKEYYRQTQTQYLTIKEDLQYEKKNFRRDSLLFLSSVISEHEYDESSRNLLQARNSMMSFERQMTTTELSIIQLEQQLVELTIQEEDDIVSFRQEIRSGMENLSAGIRKWKLTYLLTSPIDGRVSFVRKWDAGQFINAGDHYLTVVPDGVQSAIGIAKIPQVSFGKVNVGQKVNIKLNGYPYMEYGILTGTIGYLSSVPEESADSQNAPQYIAEIVFPDGLETTYGKELRMIQKMDGAAEIITKDRQLIMRFIDPIVTLFKDGI